MYILGLLFLLGIGCTTSKLETKPEVNVISGIGQGGSREIADKNAVSEIASFFSMKVKAVATSSENSIQQGLQGLDSSTLDSSVTVESEAILQGVEIVERWQEGADFFARARLEKDTARRIFKNQMVSRDRQDLSIFGQCCNKESVVDNPIGALKELSKLGLRRKERAILSRQYGVVSQSMTVFPDPLPFSKIRNAQKEAQQHIRIMLDTSNVPEILREKIAERLQTLSIPIVSQAEEANYVLSLNLEIEEEKRELKDWKFYQATCVIKLTRKQGNQPVFSTILSKRTSGLTDQLTKEKLLKMLGDEMMEITF